MHSSRLEPEGSCIDDGRPLHVAASACRSRGQEMLQLQAGLAEVSREPKELERGVRKLGCR